MFVLVSICSGILAGIAFNKAIFTSADYPSQWQELSLSELQGEKIVLYKGVLVSSNRNDAQYLSMRAGEGRADLHRGRVSIMPDGSPRQFFYHTRALQVHVKGKNSVFQLMWCCKMVKKKKYRHNYLCLVLLSWFSATSSMALKSSRSIIGRHKNIKAQDKPSLLPIGLASRCCTKALPFISSAKSPSTWDRHLVASMKCSASDWLGESKLQGSTPAFPGIFHFIGLQSICLKTACERALPLQPRTKPVKTELYANAGLLHQLHPRCEELSLTPLQNTDEAAENWALSWHWPFRCAKKKMINSLQNIFLIMKLFTSRTGGNKNREQPQSSWTY